MSQRFINSLKALQRRIAALEDINKAREAEIHVLRKRLDAVDVLNRTHETEKAMLSERKDAWRAILEAAAEAYAWRDAFKSHEDRLDRLSNDLSRLDGELEGVRCGEETQRALLELE